MHSQLLPEKGKVILVSLNEHILVILGSIINK